ncbi:MAG: phosphohydrolase [Desulfobacula sp.]|nr:phosphohydrolase [Desulfobacula sp.]
MKCPGQDTQFWDQDAIYETTCPECDHPMEFFKDDATRRCPNCKKKIVNPKMDFGCASYCQFAEECLGSLPEEFVAKREDLFKDRVAVEVKRYLGADFKRIGHTIKVANFAEKIGKEEKANLAVVLSSAYLYNIGAKDTMDKHGSSKPEDIAKESPKIAKELMEKLGAKEILINEVIDIVGHHNQPDKSDSLNRKILHDAEMLTHMVTCEEKNGVENNEFSAKLDRIFLTKAGNKLAKKTLIEANKK